MCVITSRRSLPRGTQSEHVVGDLLPLSRLVTLSFRVTRSLGTVGATEHALEEPETRPSGFGCDLSFRLLKRVFYRCAN